MKNLILFLFCIFCSFLVKGQKSERRFVFVDSNYVDIMNIDVGIARAQMNLRAFPGNLKVIAPNMKDEKTREGHITAFLYVDVAVVENVQTKTVYGLSYHFDGSSQRFTTKGGLFLRNDILYFGIFFGVQDMQVGGKLAESAKDRRVSEIWSGVLRLDGDLYEARITLDYVIEFKEFWNSGEVLCKIKPKFSAGVLLHEIYGGGPQIKVCTKRVDINFGYLKPMRDQVNRFNVFKFGIIDSWYLRLDFPVN